MTETGRNSIFAAHASFAPGHVKGIVGREVDGRAVILFTAAKLSLPGAERSAGRQGILPGTEFSLQHCDSLQHHLAPGGRIITRQAGQDFPQPMQRLPRPPHRLQ